MCLNSLEMEVKKKKRRRKKMDNFHGNFDRKIDGD